MMKIRVVMTFTMAQVALAKEHASRRSANTIVADRAVRCNRNTVANSLSNTFNRGTIDSMISKISLGHTSHHEQSLLELCCIMWHLKKRLSDCFMGHWYRSEWMMQQMHISRPTTQRGVIWDRVFWLFCDLVGVARKSLFRQVSPQLTMMWQAVAFVVLTHITLNWSESKQRDRRTISCHTCLGDGRHQKHVSTRKFWPSWASQASFLNSMNEAIAISTTKMKAEMIKEHSYDI